MELKDYHQQALDTFQYIRTCVEGRGDDKTPNSTSEFSEFGSEIAPTGKLNVPLILRFFFLCYLLKLMVYLFDSG